MLKADLHIHTLLSPCGDLEMSPMAILEQARELGLDMIAITDHNSTRQAPLIREFGAEIGIEVLMGAEVTTKEEVHCVCLVPDEAARESFQQLLDAHLPHIPNDTEKFGYQVAVDRDEMIVHEEEWLLISAIDLSIDDVEREVHRLGGLFIPAHIDRPRNSLISQLGFVPPSLRFDVLELSKFAPKDFPNSLPYLKNPRFIRSSDAHFVGDIGKCYTEFDLEEASFDALKREIGRF